MTIPLYPFQRQVVARIIAQGRAAVFAEQGTGKTFITTGLIERLADEDFDGLLVVPLANVETTWVRTLAAHLDGVAVARSWGEFKAADKPRLLLLHYEALLDKRLQRRLVKHQWSFIGYDESQRLKGRGTKQSRLAARFKASDTALRLILSGTPLEQAPQDLWGQYRFLAPDLLGHRWTDFDERWLRPCGFMGYEREFRKERLPAFLKLIEQVSIRLLKADVLDLPPMTVHRVGVMLLGEQRRVYDDLEREMFAEVGRHRIYADLAITQLVRLQQVVGGFVRDGEGESLWLGDAKIRKLKTIVAREEWPIVVFCKYREELDAIVAALSALTGRRDVACIDAHDAVETRSQRALNAASLKLRVGVVRGAKGKRGKTDRVATIEAFQRGEIDALVCQVRAGGVGLDLQRACVAVGYSCTFSFIDFDQMIARLHRHGQTRPVRIHLLHAVNTVDSEIHSALLLKRSVTEAVLRRRFQMAKPEKTKTPAPKAAAAAAPAAEKAKPTPPKIERPKYGVPELAEALGIKASSVRVQLRNKKIEKAGKLYGWATKAEMQTVIDALKAEKPKKGKDAEADDEAEEETEEEEE